MELRSTLMYSTGRGTSPVSYTHLDVYKRQTERRGAESVTHVSLENSGKNLAFFVRIKLSKGAKGGEILPVIWEDNYISLLPGEKREVTATYRTEEIGTVRPTVEVTGWNRCV